MNKEDEVVAVASLASSNAATVADGCKSAPVTRSSDARTASAFSHRAALHSFTAPVHDAERIKAPLSGFENRTSHRGLSSPTTEASVSRNAARRASASSDASAADAPSGSDGSPLGKRAARSRRSLASARGIENAAMARRAAASSAVPSV